MAKITLSSIIGGFNLSALNSRLQQIQDELNNKVLYRNNPVGEPNMMYGDLDMNGYNIINANSVSIGDGDGNEVPQPSDDLPLPNGLFASAGTSEEYSRADHVHVGLQGDPGSDGVNGNSNALVYAYKRSNTGVPSDSPGNVTFDFTTGQISLPATDALANGWTKTVPAGTDQLYVRTASASSNTATDTIGTAEWAGAVALATNGTNGANGLNAATIYIYKRSATPVAPSLPSATATYTFATQVTTGLNNGWTTYIPDIVGGNYLWVSTATAASTGTTDTIASSEWAAAQIMAQKGDPGVDGASGGLSNAIVFAYKRSATVPTDNAGDVTYSFVSGAITVPGTDALANGWTKTIPAGDTPLYVITASATAYTATDTIAAAEWTSPVKYTQNGLNAMTVFIYNRETTNVAPTLPSASCTYDFTTKTLTGLNNGWTQEVPSAVGGDYLFVSTATASTDTTTDTIPNTEWATPILMVQSGVPGVNTATVYAYQRSASAPTLSPGDVTWTFASGAITTPATDALLNGWTKTIPAGTNPLYVTVATASNSAATDTIASVEWGTPVKLAENGTQGLNVANVYIYQRNSSSSAPTLPSASATYTFATGAISGLNNGWTSTIPSDAGGTNLWATTATASSTSTTDTILNTEWAAAQILAKNGTNGTNGTPGTNGQRGSVQVASAIGGSSWSDASAASAIAAAGYGSPVNLDIVTLYNTGAGYSETKFYDFGSWVTLSAYINGNLLVSGTVAASAISAGTMTGFVIQTATSGQRVVLDSSVNKLRAYNSGGTEIAWVGGTTGGTIYSDGSGTVLPAIGAVHNSSSTLLGALYGSNSVGNAVFGSTTSGYGLRGVASGSGIGLWAQSSSGAAAQFDGYVTMTAYSEASNKSMRTNNCIPVTDNTYNLGTLAARWMGITSATAVVVSSDMRLKTDIKESDLGLSFINKLRPVSYKLIEGKKEIVDGPNPSVKTVAGTRTHYGLIAQEVKSALDEAGVDDAAFWLLTNKNDANSMQALRYEELIGPLIKAVQELSAKVKALEVKQ